MSFTSSNAFSQSDNFSCTLSISEERFILYFDDNGNVKVKRGISPIGDDPNDILKNDFNIDYINDFGKAAFEKYLALKNKINSEKDLEKKEDLISKYEELGDKYNF